MPRRASAAQARPPNPLRNQREIRAPTPLARQAVSNAAKPAKPACPNKECSSPKVEDGVCHNCGTIVDDSNIVAEVQFGENSQGAAVVQGSFVSADQGVAKSMGPGFRRGGGNEDRETTIREGDFPGLALGAPY
jgi:transcription factor IIIB subunit 2